MPVPCDLATGTGSLGMDEGTQAGVPALRSAQAPSRARGSGSGPRPEGAPWQKPPHQRWQRLLQLLHDDVQLLMGSPWR